MSTLAGGGLRPGDDLATRLQAEAVCAGAEHVSNSRKDSRTALELSGLAGRPDLQCLVPCSCTSLRLHVWLLCFKSGREHVAVGAQKG